MCSSVLVQAIRQAAADQPEVALRKPDGEQRGVSDVVDGIADRHLGGQRGTSLGGGNWIRRCDDHPLETRRGVDPKWGTVGAEHEASEQRGGDVVRVALELHRMIQQRGVELVERVSGQ